MATVTLKEARIRLDELVHGLKPGEEIIIIEDNRAIARVVSAVSEKRMPASPRKLGFLAGSVVKMAGDFDAPLDDMREYTQ